MRHSTLITILFIIALAFNSVAQRRINPVETPASQTKAVNLNPKDTTIAPDPSKMPNLIHYHDEKGNVVYVDTITGKEFIDSTTIKKKATMTYPLWDDITIGVNIWDPVMRCVGQDYGLLDMSIELSFHNRIKPIIEVGIGNASHAPDGSNYNYKSAIAPYFKIGANYNFLFNKAKEYQFFGGIRYGITPFSYEVSDIAINNSYWGEQEVTNIPPQSILAGYGELVLGLKVQIYKNLSMGWNFKYHMLLHESKSSYGDPWYIPGFGNRNSTLTGAFNIMYTIPLSKKPSTTSHNDEKTTTK